MRKGVFAAAVAFAASPKGRQLLRQAKNYVQSPEGQRRIGELRSRFVQRRPTAAGSGVPGSR
jgi:hypothetical protein